ncbi:MAG: hypothetical protein KDA65_04430 [Planctomycetaceae bacterium]|nr:hypothetical protein [Planctomycetaceae bacterium]
MMTPAFRSLFLSALLLSFTAGCQTAGRTVQVDKPARASESQLQLASGSEQDIENGARTADASLPAESHSEVNAEEAPAEGAIPKEKAGWSAWPKNPLSKLIPQSIRSTKDSDSNEISGRDAF